MEEQEKKKRGGWKRTVLIVICVILALILIVGTCVALYVNHLLDQVVYEDPNEVTRLSPSEADQLLETDPDLESIDPTSEETLPHIDDVTFATEATEPVWSKSEHVINILLVGQDRREGESRQRSDAMILVTFNKQANTITLTSFMRDSYVQIPGYKPNKLNAAYQFGGFDLLNETLYVNFGVEVDGNAEVDFSRFQELIDLLGGVEITLSEDEAWYMSLGDQWSFSKGTYRLNGEQALAYSRIRYIDSDYRRAERQRKVLLSLVDAYKSKSVTEMVALLDDILPLLKTNMSKSEIVSFVWDLFPMLSNAEFETMRIPADGTFDQGNVKVRDGLKNWFQYNIDFEANRELLREIFEAE